ncbi:4-hydroxy-tetrahydrodipicolinate synthase [Shouchella shacheensis]|uniref:4-hydroxy-tetrahydrodipicolinate synthase n=1 Tax=Shouchella shacheensis TaxID=1649580 RepID=UPI00073FCA3B|nr:4-hydroxy-tetrahydrodipicolinate synthase [Shouchella shacheensis]
MDFGQIITAMVTPFNEQGGFDACATQSLIRHLIENGSDSIVVGGTTGESPTLSFEEKKQLFAVAVHEANGEIPVIAGTGSNNTWQTIELSLAAEAAGVDALMIVVPYYNKPSQEGIYQHVKAVANATHLPIMLYNVPGRTGVSMSPETTLRLATLPNVVATKEASGNLDAVTEIIRLAPEDFAVYSGDDSLTLPMLSLGAKGVVSVASHIVGREMKELTNAFFTGHVQAASAIHQRLFPLMRGMFMAPNPTPVKAALDAFGVPCGSVRLPLLPLTNEEAGALDQLIAPFRPYAALPYE